MTDSLLTTEKSNYTDFDFMLGDLAGVALTADASDPNTTAPKNERIIFTPKAAAGQQICAFIFADAACTLEGWIYSKRYDRWVRVFTQGVATAFIGIPLTTGVSMLPIPDNFPFFLRLQANAGSAKIIGITFH